MNIANNIKKLRKSHGYTQKDLANILQVKPTAISAWESGRNKPYFLSFFKFEKFYRGGK